MSKRLHKEGKRIWGFGWQTRLAEATGLEPRTIRRMAAGETKPKKWLWLLLSMMPTKEIS